MLDFLREKKDDLFNALICWLIRHSHLYSYTIRMAMARVTPIQGHRMIDEIAEIKGKDFLELFY